MCWPYEATRQKDSTSSFPVPMASPTPTQTAVRAEMMKDVFRVADALRPKTNAYHSIWIDGVQLNLDDAGAAQRRCHTAHRKHTR